MRHVRLGNACPRHVRLGNTVREVGFGRSSKSKSIVYGNVLLNFAQLTICLVDSLKQVVKTHLMPALEVQVPTLIHGTNRWGDFVFHCMRMLLDRCPHMRMN